MTSAEPTLAVDGLVKRYGTVNVVNDLSFSVRRGSVLGLLGPNGSGKTTTVRIISTLLPFDAGTVTVLGHDVISSARDVRSCIGLAGQHVALDDYLTGFENLEMIGRLSRLTRIAARRRAHQLLELFDMVAAGKRLTRTYSGGMRRRLDLAASLIIAPEVLILDEPTTGLDPSTRRAVWGLVRGLVDSGTSVLLTTQYLEEAEELADDIVVIDKGAVIAHGSPASLKEQVSGSRLDVYVDAAADREAALRIIERFGSGTARLSADTGAITVPLDKKSRLLARVIRALDDSEIDLVDARIREPSLDDVFLSLTETGSPGPR